MKGKRERGDFTEGAWKRSDGTKRNAKYLAVCVAEPSRKFTSPIAITIVIVIESTIGGERCYMATEMTASQRNPMTSTRDSLP